MKPFLDSATRQGCQHTCFLFSITLEFLLRAKRQGKEMKGVINKEWRSQSSTPLWWHAPRLKRPKTSLENPIHGKHVQEGNGI